MIEISPLVYEFENNLDDNICDDLINQYVNNPNSIVNCATDSSLTMNTEGILKEYEDIPHFALPKQLDEIIFNSLTSALEKLKTSMRMKLEKTQKQRKIDSWYYDETIDRFIEGLFVHDTGYQIQRCSQEHGLRGYKLHDDADTFALFDPNTKTTRKRTLSALWYLNDDFDEGCGTYFPLLDYLVEPKKGKLLLFTTAWPTAHIGFSPERGFKYILTGWVYDTLAKVFVDGKVI